MMKRCREEVEYFDSINQANVLMQLARGGGEDDTSTPGRRRVFECKTCGRRFTSFQALGGHRASHKKPKVSGDDDRAGQMSTAKPKTHECSVCGLEFAMGQALGGHMRRHRASAEGLSTCHAFVEKNPSRGKRVLLDLNFPPLEEEGENTILGVGLSLGLGLLCW